MSGKAESGRGVVKLEPGVRRVLAPNPSPMTEAGTNTYILGEGEVAVIDPGPAIPAHLAAILAALEPGERVSHILVTHAHLDHSPLARALARATGAPVLGFGGPTEGRSPEMEALAASHDVGGGEGLDHDFRPDARLGEGDAVEGVGWRIGVLHTPGHLASHLSFQWEGALFSGDHVMGWASTMVSPPDGDLGAFMASCRRLQGAGHRVYYPGHGAPVAEPEARLAWLIAHRLEREAAILDWLGKGPASVPDLTARIYHDVDPRLHGAAARNVLAHLLDLHARGLVETPERPSMTVAFSLR